MKKTSLQLISILLSVMLLSACSSNKVFFDFDNGADFSQIKTYQWNKQPSAEFAKANQLIDKRIVKAINRNLNSKNLTLSDHADVTINYSISFRKKLSSSGVVAGIGMNVGQSNRGRISLSSGNQLKQTIEGTMVIDIISNKDNALIWRATSKKKISGSPASPEQSIDTINTTVKKMLDNYPPPVTATSNSKSY